MAHHQLIDRLRLVPHPEGGHYREVFRSTATVRPQDGRGERAAFTMIWFLLTRGERSRWHRIASDEVWQHHDGDPLELLWIAEGENAITRTELTAESGGGRPFAIVPAGAWQAARPLGGYVLAGCTVAPGFDFADFLLLADDPPEAAAFGARFPDFADLI